MASFDTECCLRFVSFYYTGATNCPLCSAGSYNDKTGQANCVLCPKGMYQSKTGQTGCDVCGAGTYQSAEGNANESYGFFKIINLLQNEPKPLKTIGTNFQRK